jgi:lipoate-protein ligase A
MQGHGEFKMPGGKLVVADLAIAADALAQVAISGDFFLEPDSALDAINAALTGLSRHSDADAVAVAVQAGLPEGTAMYGVSPDAIAVAGRRAIDGAGA